MEETGFPEESDPSHPIPWQRPLVVGAGGQLGAEFCRVLQSTTSVSVLRSSSRARDGWPTLDLAQIGSEDEIAPVLDPAEPDLVLCAGAMTFVDGCEAEPDKAFRVNAYGPSLLAAYAHRHRIPFVFFSSDYVFDGTAENPGPYAETDAVHPLNVYGQSKLEGERAVLRVHPEALVVRTTWVYGPDPAGKNFISTVLRQLRAGTRVRVPEDQISTPTFNRDLAAVTLDLVKAGASGVVHVAGPELMSRLALAQRIAAFFNQDPTLIDGVATKALGQRASRPLQSGLRSESVKHWLPSVRLHSLQEALSATAGTFATDES